MLKLTSEDQQLTHVSEDSPGSCGKPLAEVGSAVRLRMKVYKCPCDRDRDRLIDMSLKQLYVT